MSSIGGALLGGTIGSVYGGYKGYQSANKTPSSLNPHPRLHTAASTLAGIGTGGLYGAALGSFAGGLLKGMKPPRGAKFTGGRSSGSSRSRSSSSSGSYDWGEDFFRQHHGSSSGGGSRGSSSGGSSRGYSSASSGSALKDSISKLNVTGKETTKKEVDRAYKAMARKFHPDMGGSSEKMQDINAAMERVRQSPWFQKLSFLIEQKKTREKVAYDLGQQAASELKWHH